MKNIRFLTIIGLCCIINQTILAQPLNLVLDQPETGNQTHQAVLSITFANGYSYTPNGGSMTAEIINPAVGNISYQSEIDPNTYTINTSLPVGALNEEIQVTGNLNYFVGFELPKGAGDLQPSLGLNYMSSFSDGFLGAGFNLTGLSSISRVNKSIYFDNTSSAIAGTQNDALALDGKRLLLASGTYGAAGSVYGTEMEEFSKIVAVGSSGSNQGPQSFLIYTKSGLILEYGNTSDSRVLRSGTTVLSWKLNKITDRFNNSVVYTYYEYKDEKPVTLISYNGGISQIKFKYKHRADVKKYVYGGKEFTRDILLDNIEIVNNGLLFKKYEFNYLLDNYSQLQKITESSSAGQQMNPTVFSWTKQTDQYNHYTHYTSSNHERFFQGDYNGDGIADFIAVTAEEYSTADKWKLFLGNQSGNMNFQAEGSLPEYFRTIIPGDFDGDNKTDMIVVYSSSNGEKGLFHQSTGTNFIQNTSAFSIPNYTNISVIDYNGDRIQEFMNHFTYTGYKLIDGELVYFSEDKYRVYDKLGNTLVSGAIPSFGQIGKHYYLPVTKLIDFNGDGCSDFLCLFNDRYKLYEFKGASNELIKTDDGTNFNSNNVIRVGDFNGDGNADVLNTSGPENPVWTVLFYTSDGFKSYNIEGLSNFNLYNSNNKFTVADFNGDGKYDIIIWGKGQNLGSSSNRINLCLNKGNGYQFNITEYTSPVNFKMYYSIVEQSEGIEFFFFDDYDGDGRNEFFYRQGSTSKLNNFSSDTPSNLMKTIINGHGAKTSIVYMPMSKAGVYIKGSGAIYPVIDLGSSGQLVRAVSSDNGTATSTLINYLYTGAKVHLQGKGFLGFTKITAVNNASGVTTESNFSFDLTNYYPKITSVTKKKSSSFQRIRTTGINRLFQGSGFSLLSHVLPKPTI